MQRKIDIRTNFCCLIASELEKFKSEMLAKSKNDILGTSYMIELYIIIYEVLMANAESIPEKVLAFLIDEASDKGIIKTLYDSWLLSKGDSYNEVEKYILEEVT